MRDTQDLTRSNTKSTKVSQVNESSLDEYDRCLQNHFGASARSTDLLVMREILSLYIFASGNAHLGYNNMYIIRFGKIQTQDILQITTNEIQSCSGKNENSHHCKQRPANDRITNLFLRNTLTIIFKL